MGDIGESPSLPSGEAGASATNDFLARTTPRQGTQPTIAMVESFLRSLPEDSSDDEDVIGGNPRLKAEVKVKGIGVKAKAKVLRGSAGLEVNDVFSVDEKVKVKVRLSGRKHGLNKDSKMSKTKVKND